MSHSWGLRANRAKEMLRHTENNLHLLCHYYISCEHFRSGYDKGEGNTQAQSDEVSQWRPAMMLGGTWTCQDDRLYLEQMTFP